LEFRRTSVVRRQTGGRTLCNGGAAAARCTKGERSEAFVQRTGLCAGWEIAFRLPELLLIKIQMYKFITKV
jgi:hypothetical protein